MFEQYEDVLTVEEVANALRVGKNAAYELLGTAQIKGFRVGKTWKIPRFSLEQYVRRQSV